MADGQFPHIILANIASREPFARPGTGGDKKLPSVLGNREAHARQLLGDLQTAQAAARDAIARRSNVLPQSQNGVYLTIESRPNEPLLTERLERRSKHIELLSVREEGGRTTANVFVPVNAGDFFTKAVEDYRTKNEPRALEPEAKNRRLVEGMREIKLGALRDLWVDAVEQFPDPKEVIEWEVWLRPEATDRFRAAALEAGVEYGAYPLVFPEDVAVFARASAATLAQVNEITLSISRLARARRMAAYLMMAAQDQQARAVENLQARLRPAQDGRTALCILDTGVNREHPLLAPLLARADCHAYRTEWGTEDHHGHGTEMAGVCGYGDLAAAFGTLQPFFVPFLVESVKIFPPDGQNPYELLGAITAGGVARAEAAQPNRKRLFCLATSTDDDSPHHGRPTSWSAELDQLSYGSDPDSRGQRLFCVAAGNIRQPNPLVHADYLNWNDLQEIESPAHAWNVLTVGGFTKLTEITDPTRPGWVSFATGGDLCPSACTALWNDTWPIKPDVVLEAGNLGVDPADGRGYGFPEVKLLTTSNGYPQTIFDSFGDSSAAAGQAARMCAILQSQYPDLWPETIRALIVESAEWTEAMRSHLPEEPKKSDHGLLLKRYGYGVPNLERALFSARNALTLIAQDTIQPYVKRPGKKTALNEMKLYPLPWPQQQLNDLGNVEVQMRVTLSYFIEPNPAESARNQKALYCSHGLRFAAKLPDEEVVDFRKRVNKAARRVSDSRRASDTGWTLGSDLRDRGSLQSDFWRGPASDLARRGHVAVFPISGWWKEREHVGRFHRTARFALVISIVTPPTEIDIYTPIANRIAVGI
jgi:hypothetical protein